MKINWTVRFNNPHWWMQIALAVITPILAYFGLTGADMTTWAKVFETLLAAISNPYVCVLVLTSVWNAVQDPTTAGLSDSARALDYVTPHRDPRNEAEDA